MNIVNIQYMVLQMLKHYRRTSYQPFGSQTFMCNLSSVTRVQQGVLHRSHRHISKRSHTPADISQDGAHSFFPLMNIDIVISCLSVSAVMMQQDSPGG